MSSGGIDARKPTRPKLTPMTGTSLPRKRCSARSIVPSPPRTTAMSAPLRSCSGSPTPCFSTSSSGSSSSTAASRATFSSRSSAGPIVDGLPCVTTAARRTALRDRGGDPGVDVVGELRALTVNEVEENFPVALRAGQTGVYGSGRFAFPAERRLGDLADNSASHRHVPHDPAFTHLASSRLELRLDENDRLPTRLRERERGR